MAYTSPTIVQSGTTYAQFAAAGASGILEKLIAANLGGTGNPTAPTITATGGGTTGGNLPAGTIYVKITETNGIGETAASSEVSATISSGNIPQITFANVQSGNTGRNVYVGTAAGAEVLYATGLANTNGLTYNLSAAIPTTSYAVAPPTVNTTGLTSTNGNHKLSALRAIEKGRLQAVWDSLARIIGEFNRGEPVAFDKVMARLRDAHTTFATVAQLCSEVGTLIDANPGSYVNVATPIGGQRTKRTHP